MSTLYKRTVMPLEPPIDLSQWRRVVIRRDGDYENIVELMRRRYSDVKRGRWNMRHWVFYVPLAEYEQRQFGDGPPIDFGATDE